MSPPIRGGGIMTVEISLAVRLVVVCVVAVTCKYHTLQTFW